MSRPAQPPFALALHGGAGTILRAEMTPAMEAEILGGLHRIADEAFALLAAGGAALDAVALAVARLEDFPHFNAGHGAVLNAEGVAELDAAVMCGATKRAGAVAGCRTTRNPVGAARAVMERTPHVLLVGPGADALAAAEGLPQVPPAYFETPRRRAQWEQWRRGDPHAFLENAPEPAPLEQRSGTVGAVALDCAGHLAAATSTGGLTGKRPGRVGDCPVIGAGTWADDASCAVSCTGHGEGFLRAVAAHDVACLVTYCGLPLAAAATRVVKGKLLAAGTEGGMIALDRTGEPVLVFNTPGMYRAARNSAGLRLAACYAD